MICSFKRADGLMFITDKPIGVFNRAMELGRCVRRNNGRVYHISDIVIVAPNCWEYYLRDVDVIREVTNCKIDK